jgi:hypothetical protein
VSEDSFAGVMASMSESSSPDESPSSDSSESSGTTSAPVSESPAVAETAAPVSPAPAQVSEPGPIPYPRFKEVNDERQHLREQMQAYGWAQQIDPSHGQHVAQFYQDLRRDPVGTLIREADFIAQAQPDSAQALRSWAAKMMRSGGVVEDTAPEADLQTADGQLVYSAQQMQKYAEWQQRQLLAQVDQRINPLQHHQQELQQRELVQQARSNAMTWANQTLTQWRSRPHFSEHENDIKELMSSNPKLGLADAYVEILTSKVLPTLGARERSSVVAQMQQKSEAGTVNPSRTAVSPSTRPKSFGEAMRQLTADRT